MLRTANPTLNESTFAGLNNLLDTAMAPKTMTVNGTAHKVGVFLLLAVFTASFTWSRFMEAVAVNESVEAGFQATFPWLIGGLIGGLVFALITVFKKTWAPFTGTAYALCEGLFLGGLSAFFETIYPGIVLQAVGLTFGVAGAMVLLYSTRVLQATPAFTKGVVAATVGVMLFYGAAMLLRVFGVEVGLIHEMLYASNWIGIGFSIFVVVLAALNLVLDFDLIERGAKQGAPKWVEWYAAFGLMVTLVWLYVEALRLLAKLKGRE